MKVKICRVCKNEFTPAKPLQSVCGYKCALDTAARKRIKAEKRKEIESRQQLREDKERIKTRSQWMKEAQVAFNSWVRARDKELPCISSGRFTGAFDAGHYRSVGSCPELRFEPLNCHRQTVHDNQHLHGNLIEYRKRLIDRIGPALVAWIEGPHEPKKYTIAELKEIKALYKAKLKEIS